MKNTKTLPDRETACCHAPVLRETAGDEYFDYCWQCGAEEPALYDHANAVHAAAAAAIALFTKNQEFITDNLLASLQKPREHKPYFREELETNLSFNDFFN